MEENLLGEKVSEYWGWEKLKKISRERKNLGSREKSEAIEEITLGLGGNLGVLNLSA